MERPIVHAQILLNRPSSPATMDDVTVGQDLVDTLIAHEQTCAGLAANMIGQLKCIIAFFDNGKPTLMFNPHITRHTGEYQAEEGCLSLPGTRKALRWRRITVGYELPTDSGLRQHTRRYDGYTAEVIQHEVDHCNGILI